MNRTTIALASVLPAVLLASCGAAMPRAGHASAGTPPGREVVAETVTVDGLVVWVGSESALSATGRAYLARLRNLLAALRAAPRPPSTFAADPAAYARWEVSTGRPWAALRNEETARLVREHAIDPNTSAEEQTFHVILLVIESYRSAEYLQELSGGSPGYAGCPHDVRDHVARMLDDLGRYADQCARRLDGRSGPLAATERMCRERARWARARLATARPPPDDACLEDMPSTGE